MNFDSTTDVSTLKAIVSKLDKLSPGDIVILRSHLNKTFKTEISSFQETLKAHLNKRLTQIKVKPISDVEFKFKDELELSQWQEVTPICFTPALFDTEIAFCNGTTETLNNLNNLEVTTAIKFHSVNR